MSGDQFQDTPVMSESIRRLVTPRTAALAYMAGGVLALCGLDAVTKWLTTGYGTWQLVWVTRFVSIAAAIYLGFRESGTLFDFPTRYWRFHTLRGIFGAATAWCFYEALRTMPLADAVAVGFAAPLFITALSGPFLGEKVGRQRWVVVLIGFAGVMVALQPSLSGVETFTGGMGPFLALAAAFFYALTLITLRRASTREPSHVLLFWSQLVPLVIVAPMALLEWQAPSATDWLLILLQGSFGTAGILLMIRAFRIGEASMLAPVEYTALIWSTILGVLLFDQFPGPSVLIGAVVIMAAGFYLARHEGKAG